MPVRVFERYISLKLMFFRVRQTKRNLVKRQWIDVSFYVMRI